MKGQGISASQREREREREIRIKKLNKQHSLDLVEK